MLLAPTSPLAPTPPNHRAEQDAKDIRHLKTYEVLLKEKDFGPGPWSQSNIEPGASMLIATSNSGGVIVLGETTITYLSGADFKTLPIAFSCFKAYGKIDDQRYLLGDHMGVLSVLVVTMEGGGVASLNLERLGVTSQPTSLTYLDNGVMFVGSSFGDSQVRHQAIDPRHSTPSLPR